MRGLRQPKRTPVHPTFGYNRAPHVKPLPEFGTRHGARQSRQVKALRWQPTPERSIDTQRLSGALANYHQRRRQGEGNAGGWPRLAQNQITSSPQNQAVTMDAKPERNVAPNVINGRVNGRFAPGHSGNPGGSPEATRRAFNKRFLLDLAEDWQQHGREVLKRVRRESPAAYLKVCAMLVPREMKLEHSGGVKAMTDEQLERSLEVLKELIAKRDAAANAKVIEGEAEVVPSLPAPGSGGTKMPKAKVSLSKSP
jgi:hypothetical protein